MTKKKALSFVLVAAMLVSLAACGKPKAAAITTGEIGVIEDKQFGNVCTSISLEEFNALGFTFGDSIDVQFDNGYTLEDIPYYNGFFARTGAPLACGYPGFEHVALAFAKGDSMWKASGVTDQSKMTITLREKGKYLTEQEALGAVYTNDRADYVSDEQFANFYAITGGKLKKNTFYRSASPCDNTYQRAAYADALAKKAGIQYVLNLANSAEQIEGFLAADDFASPYYASLYKNGKVFPMHMSVNYRSEQIAQTVAGALLGMCDKKGPYLMHCLEGKDRTGFVSTLLLGLAGASTAEIRADYMHTYDNYYGINKTDTPKQYDAIVSEAADDALYYFSGEKDGADLTNVSYEEGGKTYLRFGGLNDEQIARIIDFICE
jgi:hypothetical protein